MTSTKNIENYIASNRQNAFNALRLKSKPKEIRVYVESVSDIGFWYSILEPYEKKIPIKFRFSAYSNDLTTGKDNLKKLFPETGPYLIICLDSDYDYLIQSELAKTIKKNPYIFQTYAYAMENLKCYAENLNSLCVKATNSTDNKIDLSAFLKEYSQIIYLLLIWNIYFEFIKKPSEFSRDEFCKIVTFGDVTPDKCDISPSNYPEKLNIIKKSVSIKLEIFTENNSFIAFSKQLNELGLNETNAYLFMQCHALYDFISKFLIAICDALKIEHKTELNALAEKIKTKTDKGLEEIKIELNEKTGHYFNSIIPVTFLLAANDKFTDCFLFKKITADIENYLALFKQKTQGLNHV